MRRVIALIGRFATSLLLRRVEVAGRDRLPNDRPVLLVANHFNGFVDPLVITSALGRLPRFIAKAGLRRLPVAGFLLRRAGVVFVRRQEDSGAAGANEDAFTECHRALVEGDVVAIFPEGTTHDRPRLDPIKTGAARIALGRVPQGREDCVILPVGLTFPDKVALRSSALVQLGVPIELDVVAAGEAGPGDVEAVRQLTAVIDRGLRAVSPDYEDIETALALEQAAHIALSSEDDPDPSLEERHELARRLGRADPDDQATVRREVGRYMTMLSGLRLTDDDIVRPTNPTRLLRSAFGIGVLVVLLGGVVAATVIVNVWPASLVALASLFVKTPVSKGTVRALVGLLAFPTAWITAGILTTDGFVPVTAVVVTAAIGALAAIWLVERALAMTQMLLRWQAQRERIGTVGLAEDVRADVVRAVRAVGSAAMSHPHAHVAASDCERIREGRIGQPANTVSSLAFVIAAVPIARRALDRRSLAWASVAASAALEGVGSVAYHGPGGRLAKGVHDAGIVALTASVATARLSERPFHVRPRAAVLALAAVALHTLSRTGGPLCSCNSRLQGHAVFHVLAAASLVASSPPARRARR